MSAAEWFVVNVGDAGLGEQGRVRRAHAASSRPTLASRTSASPSRSSQPGQPSGLYHAEEAQEGFLVLAGECLARDRRPGASAAPVGLLPLPARDAPRSRRARATGRARCSWSAPRGARRCRRSSIPEDPVRGASRTPRPARRRAPPSRPTPTARSPGRRSPRRGPTPDAAPFDRLGGGYRQDVPVSRSRVWGSGGRRKERLLCRAIRRAQSRTVAASRRRRRATAMPSRLRRGQVRRAMIAGTVGTSIEWYDFFLYGTAAALVFPEALLPGRERLRGRAGLVRDLCRRLRRPPVGAAIFGHFGDRIGRKATLISTLLLMGIASTLIGVLPGYATLGFWAPTLLVVLRLIQGIGVGGEWGGSVTLCMEWGNPRRRGFIGSWPQVGVPIGLLLSTGAVSLLTHTMGSSFETLGLATALPVQHRARRRRPLGPPGRARVAAVRARGRERQPSRTRRWSRRSSASRARSSSARCCACPSRRRSTSSPPSCWPTAPRTSASARASSPTR